MVNPSQWKINKLTGAIILASGLVLVGCNDDSDATSTSAAETSIASDGSFTSVNNPAGSISGLVQDTNGNPIAGAAVYVGNQQVTTNAGGLYYFDEVKVTQTVARDNGTYAQALTVSIVPPTGYLGATVTVQPQAQIFEFTTGDDTESATTPTTVFIDGFVAEAGAAVLPALTATANGTLREQGTGEALSGKVLSLDVVSVNGNDQEQVINGVTFSYATSTFTATTDSVGDFTFTNLPADTRLNITSTDLEIIGGAIEVNTDNESGMNGLAVSAVEFEYVDTISPYVVMVNQVGNQLAARGLLSDDFSNTLTVQFSETLDASLIDSNSVVIRDVTSSSYVDHTTTVSGNILTITLNSSIPNGNKIDVWLLKDDFKDISGNLAATGTKVGFDADGSTATSSQYLQLLLTSYEEANQDATSPTQAQLTQDVLGVDDLEAIQAGNNAVNSAYVTFLDVNDDVAGIQQLNSADDDDASGTPDTDTRLTALLGQIAGTIGATGATTVESDNALVEFTATNASYYYLNVTDADGNDVVDVISETILQGGTFGTNPDADTRRIDPDGNGFAITVLVGDSVAPGYTVTITPYDDFGYAGTANSITLVDNVAPTTILQTSYGVGNEDNGSVTSLQYGDGGEQVAVADVTPGTPYLDLTPRLLGQVDGTDDGSEDDVNYVETFEALYEFNTVNPVGSSNTTVTAGDQFIDEATNIYDANAWSEYLANFDFTRSLGVAFSEDISLTASAPVFTAAGTASAPTNFVANNDVTIDDDGSTVNADLVNFDIADVYDFVLQENGAVLDFTGAIQDSAGNVAIETTAAAQTNNAKVVFRDMIPPMVTSAIYSGQALTVVFDKDINTALLTADGVTMTLNGETIDLSDADNYTWDAATNTLVANLGDAYGTFITGTVFDLAQYDDVTPTVTASVAGDADQFAHGALDFSQVPNANGVSWEDYNDLGAADEGYFQEPTFAATNVVEVFDETISRSALGASTITITYEFKHAIDLDAVDGDDNVMDSNEIQDIFTWSAGSVNAAGNSLAITNLANGGSRLTFVLSLNAVTSATQTLDADFDGDGLFNGDADDRVSAYDGTGYAATRLTF